MVTNYWTWPTLSPISYVIRLQLCLYVQYVFICPCEHLFVCRKLTPEELSGVLKAFASDNVKGPYRRIKVGRRQVWKTTESQWRLPSFRGRTGWILVKFTGEELGDEPSADDGGPRREFFTLLMEAIAVNSGVFTTGKLYYLITLSNLTSSSMQQNRESGSMD